MATYEIFKETSLPGTLVPNGIYLIGPAGQPNALEIYVANSAGTATRRMINEADVNALIALQIDSVNNLRVVSDITERDGLTGLPTNAKVIVLDASDDGTVASGGAEYVTTDGGTTWTKTTETESMDLVLNWASIVGGPASTPAAIDAAVGASHTHANKTELDKIGEDPDGAVTYSGKALVTTGSLNW